MKLPILASCLLLCGCWTTSTVESGDTQTTVTERDTFVSSPYISEKLPLNGVEDYLAAFQIVTTDTVRDTVLSVKVKDRTVWVKVKPETIKVSFMDTTRVTVKTTEITQTPWDPFTWLKWGGIILFVLVLVVVVYKLVRA